MYKIKTLDKYPIKPRCACGSRASAKGLCQTCYNRKAYQIKRLKEQSEKVKA